MAEQPVPASFDPTALAVACRTVPGLARLTAGDLVLLRRKGTSNDHVRLGAPGTAGGGLVARIPRFSHAGIDAATNLAVQASAFARAMPSGHTPALAAVLPIGPGLPGGALVVAHIDGRAPRLPNDMAAIAEALAALHALPVPPPEAAPPLAHARDPVSATLAAIERHAVCLPDAGLDTDALAALYDEIAWAENFAFDALPALPPRFVGADTHPGNFLIDADGRAWFTDLEKAHYGAVPIDLAHASLPTSTGWDPDVAGTLAPADIGAFHAAWRRAVDRHGDPTLAAAYAPWALPLRRLTWLRTMTFLARWRTDWADNPATGTRDAAMDRHIATHIAHCFDAAAIAATRAQWLGPDALDLAG